MAFVPVFATLGVAWLALVRPPGRALVGAIQHLAAGVLVAAAAAEVLPGLKHTGAEWAVALGGAIGIAAMLDIRWLDERMQGTTGLLVAVGLDVLVDGLVLGAAASAGERAGTLVGIALTLEVLFLGLSLVPELAKTIRAPWMVLALTGAVLLFLPLGAVSGGLIAALPRFWRDCFLALRARGPALPCGGGTAGRSASKPRHPPRDGPVFCGISCPPDSGRDGLRRPDPKDACRACAWPRLRNHMRHAGRPAFPSRGPVIQA